MFELDALLEGQLTRQRLEDLIHEAQQERFAREVEAAQTPDKAISPLRALLIALVSLVTR